MKFAVGNWRLAVMLRLGVLCCLLPTAYCQLACSIPTLESPECAQARDSVKQFYSLHFGNDMRPSAENLKVRERFLTPEFYKSLSVPSESKTDVFTASEEPPKTFKIGECRATGEGKTLLQTQLYWRDDVKTVQKEIHVEAGRI